MDDYSGKRAGDRLLVSRKGSPLVLRDAADNRSRNAQFCSRIGCSGRLNTKASQISYSEKAKFSRSSVRNSSSGKEIIGSSSRTCSAINYSTKSSAEPQKKLSTHLETDSLEIGSIPNEPAVAELLPLSSKIKRGLHSGSENAGSSEIASMEIGSSSESTITRLRRRSHQKSGLGNTGSVVCSPLATVSKSRSQGVRMTGSRYGLRNPRCNSSSDVVPSGSPSSDLTLSRRKDVVKDRICDVESRSSARGKRVSGSLIEGRNSGGSPFLSISDTRRARSGASNRDNSVSSVRTHRSLNGNGRERGANQGSSGNLSPIESGVLVSEISPPVVPIDLNAPSSSRQFPVGSSLSAPSSYSRSSSSSKGLRSIRPSTPAEVGTGRSLLNRESMRSFNMDGIAEVLLALERIEQDEELTYEQLLVLETNLFLNGLNIYDQHRDMRLDIDNMSYEELLALEERMGSVSTALTEEALTECLKASIYHSALMEDTRTNLGGDKDDVKCSICQEEYMDGDEVGRLKCEHQYHVVCIQQWLRLKNWCPICKASAAPSSSLPPTA